MSLYEANVATDVDQQIEGQSRVHQWRSTTLNQEETGPSMATEIQQACLVIRLSPREIKLMKIK